MKILVINAGSSSLKYQVFDMDDESVLCKGGCERIGIEGSFMTHKHADGRKKEYKQDTKLLKSKKLSKEEEDAIWLKRAEQSRYNKEAKQASKNKKARTKKHKWSE